MCLAASGWAVAQHWVEVPCGIDLRTRGSIIAQLARSQGREVFAFTRPGDADRQRFARELGAAWAGGSAEAPPQEMDAAILFAPVGALIPQALRHTAKGGTVVCAGIHMSDIPEFPYSILWGERSVRSIANLTRRDGEAFLDIAPKAGVRVEAETFPLASANEALQRLSSGQVRGAAVLVMDEPGNDPRQGSQR